MIDIIHTLSPVTLVLISGSIGFIFGVMSGLLFRKANTNTERVVSILVIIMWLSMHAVSFVTDLEVARMFDFIGFGASGNIMGLNFINMAKAFKK